MLWDKIGQWFSCSLNTFQNSRIFNFDWTEGKVELRKYECNIKQHSRIVSSLRHAVAIVLVLANVVLHFKRSVLNYTGEE